MANNNFSEVFISRVYDSKEMAAWKLNEVRNFYNEAHGWVEVEGYVEPLGNNQYRAVRKHYKTI